MTVRNRLSALAGLAIAALFVSLGAPAVAAPNGPSRIVGGGDVGIDFAPWQVALYDPSESSVAAESQFCGGAIINASWVLTTGRCLRNYSNSTLGVFAGSNDLNASSRVYGRNSNRWIIHPGVGHETHDIALVKVVSAFDLTQTTMDPITLPLDVNGATVPAVGQDLKAAGWGLTNGNNPLSTPNRLRGTTLDVLSVSSATACGNFTLSKWNPRYEMCVGVPGGSSDICERDSGGGLTVDSIDGDGDLETEPVLVGLASWGEECGDPTKPRFATKVSQYLDWIIPNKPQMSVKYNKKTRSHTVNWVPVTNQLVASPVTGYRVEFSTNYGMSWKHAATVTDVTRSYTRAIARDTLWRVAAVNDVNAGLGPYLWADTSGYSGDRALAVPTAPTGFVQSVTSAGTQMRFRWVEPAATNGAAIYKYRLYRQYGTLKPVMLFEISMFPGVTPETAKTLSALVQRGGPKAKYWVTAVNNAGESVPSTVVEAN